MSWPPPTSPAGVDTNAHTDQAKAASTPIETSVSIVAAPWRALTTIARWNGHAAQVATGAASASATHCQPSNCSAPIIEIASTGTPRTAATTRRTPQVVRPLVTVVVAAVAARPAALAGGDARPPAGRTVAR